MSVTLRCDFCNREVDALRSSEIKNWSWADFPVGDTRYAFGPVRIYSETKCPDCLKAEEEAAHTARRQALEARKPTLPLTRREDGEG